MKQFCVEVELISKWPFTTPFDYFLEDSATNSLSPTTPVLKKDLAPFLEPCR